VVVCIYHDWRHSVAYIERLDGLKHSLAVAGLEHGEHSRRKLATLQNQLQVYKKLQSVYKEVSGTC
jgi:hypothetical protein